MRPARRYVSALLCGAFLLQIMGCGVTVEGHPHELATAEPSQSPAVAGRVTRLTAIFLVRGEKAVPGHRAIPDPVTLERTVQSLLSGPTAADAGHGLRSALPATLKLRDAHVSNENATVDLTGGLADISSHEQELALAQLVYTVTAQPAIDSLRVLVDGKSVEVARADGTLTTADLTRADYASLVAP